MQKVTKLHASRGNLNPDPEAKARKSILYSMGMGGERGILPTPSVFCCRKQAWYTDTRMQMASGLFLAPVTMKVFVLGKCAGDAEG